MIQKVTDNYTSEKIIANKMQIKYKNVYNLIKNKY